MSHLFFPHTCGNILLNIVEKSASLRIKLQIPQTREKVLDAKKRYTLNLNNQKGQRENVRDEETRCLYIFNQAREKVLDAKKRYTLNLNN